MKNKIKNYRERLKNILENYMPNEGIRNLILREIESFISSLLTEAEERGYKKGCEDRASVIPLQLKQEREKIND